MAEFAARKRPTWVGFMGSNCIWSSITKGNCWQYKITSGNVDDRDFLPDLAHSLFGKLFGDRGYISQPLFDKLL
jgi:hypothetical protein